MRAIQWAARASDDLDSLDRGIARRIRSAILRYAETTGGDVIRLQGDSGLFRLRVGDWRILFKNLPGDEILVLRLLHRSQAYR